MFLKLKIEDFKSHNKKIEMKNNLNAAYWQSKSILKNLSNSKEGNNKQQIQKTCIAHIMKITPAATR